jgi:uncharacterized membrane protein YeaQ/YmgE (transglycosylase-associated protein family)
MEFILWALFGALIGWVASLIMKTDGEQGIMLNIIVGVVGAIVGGWLMNLLGETGVTGFNVYSFVVAVVGAMVLISVVKVLRRV